jgi:ATP-dependent Lon protease
MNPHTSFPIARFALNVTLLPGEILPLHIFEPRYQALVADRLADDQPFTIVNGDGDSPADVGCAADLHGVTHRFDDGRMNVITRGYRRIRTLDVVSSDPYDVIRAEWLDDDTEEDISASLVDESRTAYRTASVAMPWNLALAVDVTDDPAKLSWFIADAMQLSTESRQALLEMTSPRLRLETETRWLKSLV